MFNYCEGESPSFNLMEVKDSKAQGRCREAGSGRFAEPEANLRLEEHEPNKRLYQSGELANDNKARSNQGQVQ